MAKQDPNPGPWDPSMGDGCSGVLDWLPLIGWMRDCCDKHDEAFHFGGTEADFQRANREFRECIQSKRRCWLCHKAAWVVGHIRGWGVDRFGREHFNWAGPGPAGKTVAARRVDAAKEVA